MTKTALITGILKLGDKLDKCKDGFEELVFIDDMERLVDQYTKQLALTGVVQAKPEGCGKGCDYKRVSVSWMQCKFCKGMKK